MDLVNLIYRFNNVNEIISSKWYAQILLNIQQNQMGFIIILVLALVVVGIFTMVIVRKFKNKEFLPEVKEFVGVGSSRPRFRKRDKVLFYGRKMLRKISGQVHAGGQGKKRKMVMRFARRLLQLKKDTTPMQLKVLEPPAEYLEEDISADDRVPPDALYMLQSIRVFGHFEKPVFLKLCKHTEIVNLPAGTQLFKVGDPDENVFVVQSGRLNVYITGHEAGLPPLTLKAVKPGESVTSLLSFADVLTGHRNPYKTVSARAVEDSTVVRLPMSAFQEIFNEYPEIFIRVMQVIMVRLQRVTFTALHQYLGLSAELVNQSSQKKKTSPYTGSPVKQRPPDVAPNDGYCESNSWSRDRRRSRAGFDFDPSTSEIPITANTSAAGASAPTAAASSSSHGSYGASGSYGNTPRVRRGTSVTEGLDENSLIQIATEAFVKELGLDDDSVLQGGRVQIRDVPAGTYLMKEDSHKDVALVYILSGSLVVSQRVADAAADATRAAALSAAAESLSENALGNGEVHMFTAHSGEIVGGLAVLTGEPSFFTIRAKHPTRIGLLSKNTFYSIMREHPKVVLHVAHTVVRRLSPFVRQVDFALDWLFIESGRAVYRQGDESDSTFVVLSGRLRSVITHPDGKKELVGEYGKGDLVGIVEMVTQTKRSTTVMAVRDSELAKLPEGLFNAIKLRFPIVVTRLIHLLGHRILGAWQQQPSASLPVSAAGAPPTVDSRPTQLNFSTVAVIPVTEDVPLSAFTFELYHALQAIGPALRLTSETIRKNLGTTILDANNEYRLTSWLAQQEDQHRIVLYQCDASFTPWTQRCVRQADCVLLVALFEKGPAIGKVEKEVERLTMRTQKELILLHRESGDRPTNTVLWLNNRSWVSSHHHIQCTKRMFSRRSQYRINELYSKVLSSEPNVHSDFSRLARWLTGTSVGLVLGGGGARGAAHVGMIKSIQEAGIPIDMVGGVSIGAFMGALWCLDKNVVTMTQRAREWSKKMTQWWRQILDLTYPVTSMFSGRDFNHTIHSTFGETLIEDLWLPYFTVTTDISASCMRVHTHGSLWRYIRASMSLSGYMPPLCDPIDGHLLLDGGYVNNVPADVMRSHGARHILAIDVGSQDDTDLTNYGDSLSGWWLLWKRWNPFASPVKVPNLPDIQSRLAYVSCVRQLEEVKNSDYCEYIRPPIDKYKTLQFGSFDEIKDVGYHHGSTYFSGLMKGGALPAFKAGFKPTPPGSKATTPPSYTFTDLAQLVCKVSRSAEMSSRILDESSDEEYEGDEDDGQGYASEPSAGLLDSLHDPRSAVSLSETELESEPEYATS